MVEQADLGLTLLETLAENIILFIVPLPIYFLLKTYSTQEMS